MQRLNDGYSSINKMASQIINQKSTNIAFFVDDATAENLKNDYYVKSFKYYYKTYDYSNTMINAKSDKHSESMFVIDKVLNDKNVAVLLVNGVKNKEPLHKMDVQWLFCV